MGEGSPWLRVRRWLGLSGSGQTLGRQGEREAARHLKRQGYRILAANVRNRSGELDLIAEAPDGRTVVIVEVKSGTGGSIRPEVHVNREKRRRLVALAAQFARRHRFTDRPLRFDVIGIDFHEDRPPTIRHHVAAFDASL